MLEEEFFRNRTADFFYMFLIGGFLMSMLAYFVNLLFLGHAFTIMLVYIWSRRNPAVRMNFFGLITFQAPYLPWVLLGFSILLGSSTVVDIIGIIVGHFYYFFEDVFPLEPHGFRVLNTPRFIKSFFDWLGVDEPPLPEEERPEQFNFDNNNINNRNVEEPAHTDQVPTLQTPRENDNQPQQQQEPTSSSNLNEQDLITRRLNTDNETDDAHLRARNVTATRGVG